LIDKIKFKKKIKIIKKIQGKKKLILFQFVFANKSFNFFFLFFPFYVSGMCWAGLG
jgi:hypothetical protein